MATVEQLRERADKAETAFDAAVDAGAPRAEIRRKEKAMHKAQAALYQVAPRDTAAVRAAE